MGCWEGMGLAYLLDSRGSTIGRSPSRISASLRSAAIVPGVDDAFYLAVFQKDQEGRPQVALYDRAFSLRHTSNMREYQRFLVSLDGHCQGRGFVLCMSNDGAMTVIDLAGIPRWRGSAFEDNKENKDILGVDTWRSPTDSRSAWIVVYREDAISLWRFGSDEPGSPLEGER